MKVKLPSYEYINIDSGWSNGCDEFGRWTYREDLFPNGILPVAQYLKKNGHKLGLYLLPGIRLDAVEEKKKIKGTQHTLDEIVTARKEGCGFNGSTYMPDGPSALVEAYYQSVAELLHMWGVFYVKLDGVGPGGGSEYFPNQSPDNRSCTMILHNALRKYNIWLEVSWYIDSDYADEWAQISNGARIYVDIESYSTRTMTSSHRVMQRISLCDKWAEYPVIGSDYGFYLDLDAVLVGMTVGNACVDGLDNDDIRLTYIGFWAFTSSVFCIGSDPRCIPDHYLKWYNHEEILEIHQSGIMPKPIGSGDVWQNRRQIWHKKLRDGRIYVCLINAHTYPFMLGRSHQITLRLSDLGCRRAEIRDVWNNNTIGSFDENYTILLRPGQSQIIQVIPLNI
ncbi:glycoside hydrolase superfamily [Pilobolus umbonatus]|nr:glycoside hydrolase superfamily [Pilobolus umbonatus]